MKPNPLTSDQLDAMAQLCEQLIAYYPTWQANRAARSAKPTAPRAKPQPRSRARRGHVRKVTTSA